VMKTATGETFEDDADILLSARGALNDIAWPQVPGLDSFQGELMHSAAWNQKLVFGLLSLNKS
jgi:cation diffusion facilitator CzcD-associated flavoprotein CzcO